MFQRWLTSTAQLHDNFQLPLIEGREYVHRILTLDLPFSSVSIARVSAAEFETEGLEAALASAALAQRPKSQF